MFDRNLIMFHRRFALLLTATILSAVIGGPVEFGSGSAIAGPYEDAGAAYTRGDYATALRLMRPLADQGDARAQSNLGLMYAEGKGVPQDFAEAVRWYRKAADQGYARAQSNLGLKYDDGQGVPQDYAEAVKWYRKAADQGYARAQFNLGDMYAEGKGVPKDPAEAVRWYRKAAEQGEALAQAKLDDMVEPAIVYHDPGAIDLCPPPHYRMTAGDGCVPTVRQRH